MIKIVSLFFLLIIFNLNAQIEKEIPPPYNIKTVTFVQNGQNVTPFFQLGDNFSLEFDDLFGNEANYYYSITMCDYDWKVAEMSKNEYILGFDDMRIQDYTNSFNTLQIYSHYKISFPNKNTQIKLSGNYMLKILNEDKEVIFAKKMVLYENIAQVALQVRRTRQTLELNYKHNLDFTINSNVLNFQNPLSNVKVVLMQNGQWQNAISNIKPQYTIGNDLIYRYDKETQFWAGNEFLYFDSKDIRIPTNVISFVDSNSGVYNTHLYANTYRSRFPYTFYPDINGNFVIRRLNAENSSIEADYSWVFFTLKAPNYSGVKDIYINGMFNNYAFSPENKMDYNADTGYYEKAIMIKQGFVNYQYVLKNTDGTIDEDHAVDGNFYQTENNYAVLVYYRENGGRYDRVIAKGDANSTQIIN
ncbi:DUF5103 domain-containing protein [Flavobacterium branchiophilum]|uniref:Type 9 secretion system plug protein N-terminal domain-containing protein n=2 Tax=Flavobacterium branchiophilum TaxID=55197 RepID=G2Z627_FLABF|nr:DUF5103 domain-containing protein [Flavobacterium branchiophilum]PDS24525.1 DUF5103 domain-containing protein [Flavobacterium branchiophilum]CCB68792.1 Protein of unknown function precursor [Flavobacterium branchiophilum FL-15]